MSEEKVIKFSRKKFFHAGVCQKFLQVFLLIISWKKKMYKSFYLFFKNVHIYHHTLVPKITLNPDEESVVVCV